MKRILLSLLAVMSITIARAQTPATDLKKMADDKKFKFIAKNATLPVDPSTTSSAISSDRTEDNHKTLTGNYYATLTPDSVASYLPYYDKTQTQGSDVNVTTTVVEDPSKSLATSYDYQVKQKKNGDVNITVKPKSGKLTKYVFTLQLSGKAKLEATIDDYKVITFDGTYTK
ncbi:MAG TPA: DUF4251 domain-containing protein [Mucilaginibacter sp.]|jgi:hypothetical protein|nr:DUF4251 domain-containing protein [Mucilaginibacter sp.]